MAASKELLWLALVDGGNLLSNQQNNYSKQKQK
jgi:hypothetical protein